MTQSDITLLQQRLRTDGRRLAAKHVADMCDEAADAIASLLSRIEADKARIEELEKGLEEIDGHLWATSGSSNVEALIACMKEIERTVRHTLLEGKSNG